MNIGRHQLPRSSLSSPRAARSKACRNSAADVGVIEVIQNAFRNEQLAADIDLLKTAVGLFRLLCERPGEANFADLKTIRVRSAHAPRTPHLARRASHAAPPFTSHAARTPHRS